MKVPCTPHFRSCLFVFLLALTYSNSKAQTTTRPAYPLKFCYTNSAGIHKDTILTRQAFTFYSKATAFPDYLKWKNLPFAVLRSPLNGVGLFTDSASSFSTGDTIGLIFYKVGRTGRFDVDYYQTNLGSFINNGGNSSNTQVISTPQGLLLKATQSIASGTEITCSYQEIINLFPNDQSVVRVIKYW